MYKKETAIKIVKILKEYYHENCAPLIFFGEKKLSANSVCKMYFADVLEEKELENYKKVFQEYLALYVKSYDKLKYYSINDELTEEQVSNALVSYSKSIWKNSSLIITDIDNSVYEEKWYIKRFS